MLILLPPSETKAVGGGSEPLNLDRLSFPGLNPVREQLLVAIRDLAADLPAARNALGVAASKDHEILANGRVLTAGTLPALQRYTGVLYDALDVRGMTKAQRARAGHQIAIGSALFGVVAAGDLIPAYRLSAGSKLPGLGTLAALFKPTLAPVLGAIPGCVVDLRSGSYAAFAPVPGAITVRVMTERPDGSRSIVSHHNKSTKGYLARVLATSRADITDARTLVRVAAKAGLRVERPGDLQVDVIVTD